ncbi:MAG TPA: hypothetical protein VMN60_03205 [Longimicrobiales bacterium]|nr:hypothetical protein [Longimicrobiales bacterium]
MSSTQWLNIGDDAGALHALLQHVADHTSVDRIRDIWIFPPRRIAAGESIVIVIGAQGEIDTRRRVITARFTVVRNRKGAATVNAYFDEHGTAPMDAMPRIVQGVLRRLGEDTGAAPREDVIDGDPERWTALLVELGARPRADHADPPTADAGTDALDDGAAGHDPAPMATTSEPS